MRIDAAARAIFVASTFALVFAYGYAVGHYEIVPFQSIHFGAQSLKTIYKERTSIMRIRPDRFLENARYAGSGVTRLEPEKIERGLTFLQGFFDGGNEMRLIRPDGSISH